MKLIFSDLDGTLLDHHTYRFDAASAALAILRNQAVPLVLCSSKTKPEMLRWQERLNIREPFIAENGAAVYFPRNYRGFHVEGAQDDGSHAVLETGIDRATLKEALYSLRESLDLDIRSFSDMGAEEVMELTSLGREEALLAMERRYTEPFLIGETDIGRTEEIVDALLDRGFAVVRGGRFQHLMGPSSDKGTAVRCVTEVFRNHGCDPLQTMGLGDSENDLSMLRAVDRPVIVRRWDGSCLESEGTDGYTKTEGIGPVGWNEAVIAFLSEKE